MPWFKADDGFPQHPKVLAIPRKDRAATIGLWSLAGMWCAGQLTDGFIPTFMLDELSGSKRNAQLLVDVGLWEVVDGGWQMHDYLDYNPTAEEVRADQRRKHEAKAKAGRAGGIASGVARRKHEASSSEADAKQDESETKPRPDPSPTASKEAVGTARKRASRIPDDFALTEHDRGWGRSRGFTDPQIDEVTEQFVRYWRGKSGRGATKLDWPGTWQNWIAKEDPAKVRVPLRTVAPNGERAWSVTELEAALGPDKWTCPQPPAGMTADEMWEWEQQTKRAHRVERIQQAEAKQRRTA